MAGTIYNDQQIADYAHQLEQKGAPETTIRQFVSAAKADQLSANGQAIPPNFGQMGAPSPATPGGGFSGSVDGTTPAQPGMSPTQATAGANPDATAGGNIAKAVVGAVDPANIPGEIANAAEGAAGMISKIPATMKVSSGPASETGNPNPPAGQATAPGATPPASFKDPGSQFGANQTGELAKGVVKEGIETGAGLMQLFLKGDPNLQAAAMTNPNAKAQLDSISAAIDKFKQDHLTANNPAQAAGKAGAQVGEFMVPGLGEEGAATEAATTVGGKAMELAGQSAKGAAEMGAVSAAQQGTVNKDVATNAAIGGAFPIAGAALKTLGGVAAEAAKYLSSTLSGVPVDAITHAIKNPEAVQAAIKTAITSGDQAPDVILQNAQEALQNLKDARSKAYQSSLSDIVANTSSTIHDLSTAGVKKTAQQAVEQFGGKVTKGVIDPAGMSLVKSDANQLQEMMGRINTWKDNTPLGVNKLRQIVDSYTQGGVNLSSSAKQFNKIVGTVRDNLDDYVGTAHPAIADMNATYKAQSSVLSNLQDQLKMGSKDPNTALRKLLNVFNPKAAVYKPIVQELGAKGGKDLMSDIAGVLMSKWTPEGLGKFATTFMGGLEATHPGALATLPLTAAAASPRIVGAAATAAGKAGEALGEIPPSAGANAATAIKAIAAKKKP